MARRINSSLGSSSNQILSKTVSHALRHEPWLYELELDENGWVSIELLLVSLRREREEWIDLSESDLVNMIASSNKKRHEIQNDKIRAVYGHSLPGKLLKQWTEPPEILYHGTSINSANKIRSEGLKPMSRQYVHLSTDIEMAKQVGLRKTEQPVILEIMSKEAHKTGVKFYKGNDYVWLTDFILPKFIKT